jgi:hypothetical protein
MAHLQRSCIAILQNHVSTVPQSNYYIISRAPNPSCFIKKGNKYGAEYYIIKMARSKYDPSKDSCLPFHDPSSEIKNGLLRTWSTDAINLHGKRMEA